MAFAMSDKRVKEDYMRDNCAIAVASMQGLTEREGP